MAVRLPVVLSQSTARSPKISSIEDSWITHLLLESRLDATLIGDLKAVRNDSTDQLCLEGIKGDFVLINWLSSEESLRELQRLGIAPARIVPLGGTSGPSNIGPAVKKIYHLQLTEQSSIEFDGNLVASLLQSLSTPVFQLQLGGTKKNFRSETVGSSVPLKTKQSVDNGRLKVEGQERTSNDDSSSLVSSSNTRKLSPPVKSEPIRSHGLPGGDQSDKHSNVAMRESAFANDKAMDDLVDELNNLDI